MFDSKRMMSPESLLPWVALDGGGVLTNFFAFPSSVLLVTFTIKLAATFLCHLFFWCIFKGLEDLKSRVKQEAHAARPAVKKVNGGAHTEILYQGKWGPEGFYTLQKGGEISACLKDGWFWHS